ncbi:HPr family phosphocarrier protein [Gammaproteobacteria bacterium]|nr:HPr family phosphocarrier protein [Gammaproteobacteria bacterium]
MIKTQIKVQNKLGLHTRAAAKLVNLSSTFESKIELINNLSLANCKSIMSLILLGASNETILDLHINGNDEQKAFTAIENLFNNKFGEDE